jgi:hypothetical protein
VNTGGAACFSRPHDVAATMARKAMTTRETRCLVARGFGKNRAYEIVI